MPPNAPILPLMPPRPRRPPKERPFAAESAATAWRLFLAVPLPPPVTALVDRLVRDLAAEDWPVRWVAPETAHITLHFLGDTSPERAELLRLALSPVVTRHPAFDLRTAGLGVFPSRRHPRVLWLGLHGPAHRLESLHRDLDGALRGLDFTVEEGQFHPHITLGRVRAAPSDAGRAFAAAIARHLDTPAATPVTLPIREVLLVRSFLSHRGARHEPIAQYPLTRPTEASG